MRQAGTTRKLIALSVMKLRSSVLNGPVVLIGRSEPLVWMMQAGIMQEINLDVVP